jgi:hypothetical protein
MEKTNKVAVVSGHGRMAFGSRILAALGAALAAGGPAVMPTQRASRSKSSPRRASWKVSGSRKTGYQGQTPEQKAYYLERAQTKRARRAINCTENARRSAEGYHPWAILAGIRSSLADFRAQLG